MGCSNSSCSKISPNPQRNPSPYIVCNDRLHTLRFAALGEQLNGIHDLVVLIVSYIPLNAPYFPTTHMYGNRREFFCPKPRHMFEHAMWNYYATQSRGVALYVIVRKTYQEAVWFDEMDLKLQILDLVFKPGRHPNCLRGFRSIVQNSNSVPQNQIVTISNHLSFWIERLDQQIASSSLKSLELKGVFPLVWIILTFLLQSKTLPMSTKTKIIEFLDDNPAVRFSIRDHWANLGGIFLDALRAPDHLWKERIQQKL